MNKNNFVNPGSSVKANILGNIVYSGMPVVVASVRLALLLSPSQILLITNLSGWQSLAAKDNPLDICSPTNLLTPLNSPGRLFSRMLAAGKSKWRSVTTNVNWLWRAPEYSSGNLATNYC